MKAFTERPQLVWIALVVATLGVFGFQAEALSTWPRVVGSAILAVAYLKVRLIGLYFMELDSTVPLLRFAFEAWAAILAMTLIVMFAMA